MSDDNVIYDYSKVVGWSDYIEGGLSNLEQLFVPINIINKHWIFIRVQLETHVENPRQEQRLAKAGEHV